MGIVDVVGGVDTHADLHVAAAVDANGGVLDVGRFPASVEGYEGLLAWLADLGGAVRLLMLLSVSPRDPEVSSCDAMRW